MLPAKRGLTMKFKLTIASVTLLSLALSASFAQAQVFVRAPFVRVYVGPGDVQVRAPFVNLNVPAGPRAYLSIPLEAAPNGTIQPPTMSQYPPPIETIESQPQQFQGLTLDQFARAFQPQAGTYDVTLINPVNRQPTTVRFTLPEGSPRVLTRPHNIEFQYFSRQWVRLEFDRDGVTVVSR